MKRYQVQDFEPTSQEGFTKRVFQKSPHGLVFTLNFLPGQTLAPHTHVTSELLVTVLDGQGEVQVDDKPSPISQGTIVWCQGHERFGVRNTGPGRLSLLVVLYPAPADNKFAGDIR